MASLKTWAKGSWATISTAPLSGGCSESTHARLVSGGSPCQPLLPLTGDSRGEG
jgi:hypothetical protein